MDIGFEFVPERWEGNFPYITIHRKLSQKDIAHEIATVIEDAVSKWLTEKTGIIHNVALMPCSHSRSEIISSDGGTSYCGACEREA